jgi:hypothetical protein
MEADRVRKVSSPKLDREALDPDLGAQADSQKVFDQELDVHGDIAPIGPVFPLGYDAGFMDAGAQLRFYQRRKSAKDHFNTQCRLGVLEKKL